VNRLFIVIASIVSAFLLVSPASALFYTFSGESAGGIGSATMDVTVSGNQLTVIINNTSPTRRTDGKLFNSPSIDGVGFNLGGLTSIEVTSWSLYAYPSQASSTTVLIGGTLSSIKAWNFGNIPGETFNIELTNGSGVQGGLYSPSIFGGNASGPYYTTATLTMFFDVNIKEFSLPFIRMQNVGADGEGSLKLPGDPGGGIPAPEPGTMLLLGLGLIGIALVLREMKR
jgi:hypothetical protein